MLHESRRYGVKTLESMEEIAAAIVTLTWTGCAGFAVTRDPDLLILNDALSPDGVQEYAVVRKADLRSVYQLDSLSISWMTYESVLESLEDCRTRPRSLAITGLFELTLEPIDQHECPLCR